MISSAPWKYYVLRYENGKMRHFPETIPEKKEGR
jgi:hypothetical protein